MYCWNCGKELEEPGSDRVAFRATCDFCSSWLHCCKNCKNYQPGLPNDCKVPGTEPIADREACNFCDEFELQDAPPSKDKKEEGRGKFNDLFKD